MRAGIRLGSGAGVFGFCIRMQSRALTRRFAPPSPASQERGSRSTPRGLAAGRESSDKLDVLVVARLLFHVALPGGTGQLGVDRGRGLGGLLRGDAARSEEHTSELQSLMRISYAVFCLKKKNKTQHARAHSPTPITETHLLCYPLISQ